VGVAVYPQLLYSRYTQNFGTFRPKSGRVAKGIIFMVC
jgi:hypothetical protein